ncbi:MAG: TatD family hydrolase [Deltaproteobacteria bacterium]|jgi:TatD DNase family protein|nr:TatD family hydrolase [Deltaproteobacteria bacterium]MBT4525226.1 TatD family hydrolase [Deltaproteobacteria bacterium]
MSANFTWVDTHCHLEKTEEPLESVISKSKKLNVSKFITIGTEHTSNQNIDQITQSNEDIYGTVGFHPHDASEYQQVHADWMIQAIEKNAKILAIGECGLDYFYEFSDKTSQKSAFASQLEIANEFKFPVVIHTRNAEQDTIDIMEAMPSNHLNGVFHCFTSSLDLAKYALNKGFYLSFNGICTFPKSDDIRAILKYTPQDRILLETDSPYLAPVPHRGKTNFPGYVSIVGEYIADFLNLEPLKLAQETEQNAKTLFPRFMP